jgi:hypothetical protein
MARSVFHAPIPRTNLGLIRRGGRATATDARTSERTSPIGPGPHWASRKRRGQAPRKVLARALVIRGRASRWLGGDAGMRALVVRGLEDALSALTPTSRARRRCTYRTPAAGSPAEVPRTRFGPCLIIIIIICLSPVAHTHEISPPARTGARAVQPAPRADARPLLCSGAR